MDLDSIQWTASEAWFCVCISLRPLIGYLAWWQSLDGVCEARQMISCCWANGLHNNLIRVTSRRWIAVTQLMITKWRALSLSDDTVAAAGPMPAQPITLVAGTLWVVQEGSGRGMPSVRVEARLICVPADEYVV